MNPLPKLRKAMQTRMFRLIRGMFVVSTPCVNPKIGLVLTGRFQAGSPCSHDFLQAIISVLQSVIVLYEMEDDTYYNAKNEDTLVTVKKELQRLEDHPELYPSAAEKSEFLQIVHVLCDFMVEELIPHESQNYEFIKKFVDDYNKTLILPAYDGERTSWQQVFHTRAPGTGFDVGQVDGNSSSQIVPYGGFKLQLNLRRQFQTAKDEMQRVGKVPCDVISY